MSTQETSAFYEGFLKPIDLTTLAYFIRQGYPREMLFWLFMDSFELDVHGRGKIGYHYSPPDDYGCSATDTKHRCFIDWIRVATMSGLTVEEKTSQKSGASGASGGEGKGGGEAKSAAGGKASTTAYARFCFNQVLAQQAIAVMSREEVAAIKRDLDVQPPEIFNSNLTCGSRSWDPTKDTDKAQPDILPLEFTRFNFTITPRSAYGVFEFLGNLMKIQRDRLARASYAYISPGREYAESPPELETVHEDPALLKITQNLGGRCFVHSWFEDGDYCVPEDATTTKRIFGLLAQLIAIQTAATDLSITPVVRVLQ